MQSRTRAAVRIRPKSPPAAERDAHRIAVFTSIDGTLLDARTFDPGENRDAIRRLLNEGIPVIPISVMTLDELAPIAADLGLHQAMVVEAGGAIARWRDGGWEVQPCGPQADTLLDVVREIEDRSGASLLVYSAMDEQNAAQVSGRSGEMLVASRQRRFSEPFVIEKGDLEAIRRAAATLGFSVRRGRRFFHLGRECDEGEAFLLIRNELKTDLAIAVGGALVDAEFLSRADVAILVPGADGTVDAQLLASVPGARIAPSPAPAGWAEAVLDTVGALKRRRSAVS